jgi:hypothetical protein
MQSFAQINLAPIAAAFLKSDGTFVAANCKVTHVGAGSWQVTLLEGFPLGTYLTIATPNGGPINNCLIATSENDATVKLVFTWVGGVATDFNCSVIFYALPL